MVLTSRLVSKWLAESWVDKPGQGKNILYCLWLYNLLTQCDIMLLTQSVRKVQETLQDPRIVGYWNDVQPSALQRAKAAGAPQRGSKCRTRGQGTKVFLYIVSSLLPSFIFFLSFLSCSLFHFSFVFFLSCLSFFLLYFLSFSLSFWERPQLSWWSRTRTYQYVGWK